MVPLLSSLVLAACATDPGAEGDDAESVDTDGPADTDGPDASTDPDDPDVSGSDGPDDPTEPLAACRDLPGADTWIQGPPVESQAESTDARMRAAGELTWPLALDLLRSHPSSKTASIANSPASMYIALGLAYGRHNPGQCGERIAEVMRYPELDDDLHNTLGASAATLESRALPAEEGTEPLDISLRQSTWSFETDIDESAEPTGYQALYGASPHSFTGDREHARDVINCVIEEQSKGLLVDFLPEGDPAGDTTAYDVNVSYLAAPWISAMSDTPVEFHYEDGTTQAVDGFGNYLTSLALYEGEAFTTVTVPFRGNTLQFFAVLPPQEFEGGIDAFTESLDEAALATAREEAISMQADFSMPKVDIASETIDYNNDDDGLGFECEPFTLRKVLHGAAVQLDEKGIKAAAATVVEEWGDGEPEPQATIDLDRPFLFFVYDRETQFVLYSGRHAPDAG